MKARQANSNLDQYPQNLEHCSGILKWTPNMLSEYNMNFIATVQDLIKIKYFVIRSIRRVNINYVVIK